MPGCNVKLCYFCIREHFFVSHTSSSLSLFQVTCVGQVIGLVVADNKAIAQLAAKLVKVDYEELPAIITIEVGSTG